MEYAATLWIEIRAFEIIEIILGAGLTERPERCCVR